MPNNCRLFIWFLFFALKKKILSLISFGHIYFSKNKKRDKLFTLHMEKPITYKNS